MKPQAKIFVGTLETKAVVSAAKELKCPQLSLVMTSFFNLGGEKTDLGKKFYVNAVPVFFELDFDLDR